MFRCILYSLILIISFTPDIRILTGSREFATPFNSWCIESESDSKDINIHLRELFDRLAGKHDLIEAEFGTPGFSILWKGDTSVGPFFEVDVIAGIALFEAELWQEIYQIEIDDDE